MEVDNKFRVSMEDSTMMCMLHSAMNKAHAKVESKEGVIERLNEQSKFYELAIIQLEACLMFVQEEEGNYILETTHNRLLFELLEMKDKFIERLQETDDAIAEKDKEMNERFENESRLRQILEAKEKELQFYKQCKDNKTDGRLNGECELSLDEYIVENSIKEDIYMDLFGETFKEMILYDQEKIACELINVTKEGTFRSNQVEAMEHIYISESNTYIQRFNPEEAKTISLEEKMPNLWNLEFMDYKYNFVIKESIQWCTLLEAIKQCGVLFTKVPKISHGKIIESLIKELKSLLSDFGIEMSIDCQGKMLLAYETNKTMDLPAITFDNDIPCIQDVLDMIINTGVLIQEKMNLSNSRYVYFSN